MTHRPQPKQPPIPSQRWHPHQKPRQKRKPQNVKPSSSGRERSTRKERKQQFEREQAEIEAEHNRRAEIIKGRQATFERILENAPTTLCHAQLRILLRAIVNLDPYTFADDLAEDITEANESEQRSAEEVLLSTIDATADDKLTRFALRLALAGHVGIPREGEFDFLTEAESVFVPPQTEKKATAKKAKQPTSIESSAKATTRTKLQKATSKKKIAA
jgi:ParB family chromosome partitioning protein